MVYEIKVRDEINVITSGMRAIENKTKLITKENRKICTPYD
jgi:hypothetical protein